jgi:PBP1b-binding outer membrane lipoprotein LpoB
MIVDMKRVLALALVGGALLLGGCDRSQAAAPPSGSDRPAATVSPVATSAAAPKSDKSDSSSSSSDDVDSLLKDVDKQLTSDDQPPADQD